MKTKKCSRCKMKIRSNFTKSIINPKKYVCYSCRIKEAIDLLKNKKRDV